jgi:hypothetical protein
MNITKNAAIQMVMVTALSMLSACGTMEQPYKPCHMGTLQDSSIVDGLEITLVPDKTTAKIGDLLTFYVIIKNVGSSAVLLPAEPDVLLTWIYPDGKRDNFIQDDSMGASASGQNVRLDAGKTLVLKSALTTYYFNNRGITEFRARVSVNRNTLAGGADSRRDEISSNGFGVLFDN